MLGQLFKGFYSLHGLLLLLFAIGFFIFWARTRFWLPRYAHIFAVIGLVVGLFCASNITDDAPIAKHGPIVRALFPLVVPAIVYFFFIFYGGQRAAFRSQFDSPIQCPNCDSQVSASQSAPSPSSTINSRPTHCPNCGLTLK